jgi:hypothetical protein
VGSFGDERVRFVDLPRNCGEQSGPNNECLRLARGRYIALLNHDDLWTPRHLEVCTAGIERTGADLVFRVRLRAARPLARAARLAGDPVPVELTPCIPAATTEHRRAHPR